MPLAARKTLKALKTTDPLISIEEMVPRPSVQGLGLP